ncbi:cation-translocating P-type ATPase [Pontibacter ramchanderi]|uniref:Ca2+-transporting ATPase n=1 Tax=Pontibacter ramchanderi TaxID=1179743 RepID=A0A2N3V0S4_9BACT|nr:cation-translocating P-type ATPase [Pontibacter ramchanderi]PKV75176.1 Ca2+-transporting ATPase [Pontibacter ramchanderi]
MWFSKPIETVLTDLAVNPTQGLSDAEAKTRLNKYGPNKLTAKKKKSVIQLFLAQLNDWLIYVLFAAVVITLFMGEYIDSIIIVTVIILNAVLGVVQEVKAGNAIEALQKISSPKALVRRDGVVQEIDSEAVVPGDVLVLDTGRYVAADLRLLESANLQIEESALTGESVPSPKDASITMEAPNTPLGDRDNAAFMSTLVTAGRGMGVVVSTGMQTEVGKIATIIQTEEEGKTPLEVRLNHLGKTLGKFAIGICVLIFLVALLQGRDLAEMFLISVSLAVASIPEGLAAIVAIVLSIGVTSMSKRNAIIRRLPAVETLGSVNIICSDKTGTLTQNKMTVMKYFTLEGETTVKAGNLPTADATLLASAMVLCSDATYQNGEGTGDPTEIALLLLADDLGIDRAALAQRHKRLDEYAFDSDRKMMSTLVEADGRYRVYTKGAIDNLLKIATQVQENGVVIPLTEAHRQAFQEATQRMSEQALRTLGVAYKPTDKLLGASEMEQDLILLGLVGMMDPPRTTVKESVHQAKEAGITTVMITGDHKITAFAIARQLGIADQPGQVMTGQEIDELTDSEFSQRVSDFRIFARVSPEHKVRIVRALKAQGNIVSMTGDGVNDAPSLNTADIGVAMGITGTDVAKGASDMILTDDNFATIVSAIEQGRNIYNNIRKAVLFLLSCNLGEVVAMFITLMIGWEAPLIATQLLWINLLTDSLPAVALGMDPGDPDVMQEKPRDPKESFFTGIAGWRVMGGGLLIGVLTIFAFWFGYYEHGYSPFDKAVPTETLENARTLAFMTLVASQLFYALAMRHQTKSIFQLGLFSNRYLLGAILIGLGLQLIVIATPFMREAFNLTILDTQGWWMVLLLGLVPLLVNELGKIYLRARRKKERTARN